MQRLKSMLSIYSYRHGETPTVYCQAKKAAYNTVYVIIAHVKKIFWAQKTSLEGPVTRSRRGWWGGLQVVLFSCLLLRWGRCNAQV